MGWFLWQERRYELPVSVLRRLPFPLRPPHHILDQLEAAALVPDAPEVRERREAQRAVVEKGRGTTRNRILALAAIASLGGLFFREEAGHVARGSLFFAHGQLQKLGQLQKQQRLRGERAAASGVEQAVREEGGNAQGGDVRRPAGADHDLSSAAPTPK